MMTTNEGLLGKGLDDDKEDDRESSHLKEKWRGYKIMLEMGLFSYDLKLQLALL